METVKKVSLIAGVKAAEASLAREDARRLESAIPEGHPLRAEMDKQKALVGDLSQLPPGHPLLQAIVQAKERYEQAAKTDEPESETKQVEVRHARKLEEEQAKERRAAAVEKESQDSDLRYEAAGHVNKGIDATLLNVRDLYRVMSENEETLNTNPLAAAKVGRLKRLLFAAERGLSECRILRV